MDRSKPRVSGCCQVSVRLGEAQHSIVGKGGKSREVHRITARREHNISKKGEPACKTHYRPPRAPEVA